MLQSSRSLYFYAQLLIAYYIQFMDLHNDLAVDIHLVCKCCSPLELAKTISGHFSGQVEPLSKSTATILDQFNIKKKPKIS